MRNRPRIDSKLAMAVGPATQCCPVKIPVSALNDSSQGLRASGSMMKLCSVVSVPLGVVLKTSPLS